MLARKPFLGLGCTGDFWESFSIWVLSEAISLSFSAFRRTASPVDAVWTPSIENKHRWRLFKNSFLIKSISPVRQPSSVEPPDQQISPENQPWYLPEFGWDQSAFSLKTKSTEDQSFRSLHVQTFYKRASLTFLPLAYPHTFAQGHIFLCKDACIDHL